MTMATLSGSGRNVARVLTRLQLLIISMQILHYGKSNVRMKRAISNTVEIENYYNHDNGYSIMIW